MEYLNVLITVLIFAIFSLVLSCAIILFSKLFYVKEDPRSEEVMKQLPKINCGSCGYPGCASFANAIVYKGENPRKCKPIKKENIEIIVNYLEKTTGPNGEYESKEDV